MAKAKTVKKAFETKPVEAPSKKKEKVVAGARRNYSPTAAFEEGDTVYHEIWDDEGEVIEIGSTEDGIRKMRVQFTKVGLKTLCMGQS